LSEAAIHIRDWVRADSYTDTILANIVRGRLEAEGIPAMIANEHTVTVDWLYSQAIGGVRVMVPPQFLHEAREIIRQIDAGEFSDGNDDEALVSSSEERCLKCQKPLHRDEHLSWKVSLLTSLFFMLPMPFRKHRFYCPSCKT
jgi:Putative prokaryotic signal transducing protein